MEQPNKSRRRQIRNELNYRDRGGGKRPYFYQAFKQMNTADLRKEYERLLAGEGMVAT